MAEINPRVAMALVAFVGALTVVLAAAGQWRLVGAGAGVLLTAVAVIAIDASSRSLSIRRQVTLLTTRVNELFTKLDATATSEKAATPERLAKQVSAAVKGQTREVEALLQLYGWVEPREPMPASGQWAMNPQGLLALFGLVRSNRPRLVVELGSGTSTVWLGYALAANGPVGTNGSSRVGRLVSIDHEPKYAAQTREMVGRHGYQMAPTEVRDAPLAPLRLGAEDFQWYAQEALKDLAEIDLLIIDGPPRKTGPLARYPAVPALVDQLADGAIIVLDDATRDDEKAAAERWLTENAGMTRQSSPINRLAVFRYSAKN